MTSTAFEADYELIADIEAGLIANVANTERTVRRFEERIGASVRAPVDHAALWRHARRRPGDPVDFAAMRMIRTDPAARTALARMMAAQSIACSQMAFAAADSGATARQIGDYGFSLEADPDSGLTALVIALNDAARVPHVLRAETGEQSLVLPLPEPQDGLIEMYFAHDNPDQADIIGILAEPTALIALE
ncbi:hypothetical protein HDIA_3354 [Hartmannibacter diazotrophicus]|uniref:Uncharacterized protein n=1 Tax=Hartmannibacter diazotrophicus TaxID=1482074 RepID=A0A2C9DBA4_9HYPH|nr:hypothetical protein [Hartmannibacter diazotrophicus]SON56895.1 hypothetical protein HDIA_3354 [Hartmannibacter diazotrophicus]